MVSLVRDLSKHDAIFSRSLTNLIPPKTNASDDFLLFSFHMTKFRGIRFSAISDCVEFKFFDRCVNLSFLKVSTFAAP